MHEAELLRTIQDLVQAQLVVAESTDQFSFRHALTRDAVYATLLVRERRKIHRAIADTLEYMNGESHVADLAYHYYEAEAWDKASEYSLRAAELAHSLYAPRETAEYATRALFALKQLGRPAPLMLYRLRGQAYEVLGDFESARTDQEAALQAARRDEDRHAEWQALTDLGKLWAGRDYSRTGDYFEQAQNVARSLGAPLLLAHSLNWFGNWLVNTGQGERGLQLHYEALDLFEAQNDTAGMAATFDLIAISRFLTADLIGSQVEYEKAIALFRQMNDKERLASSLIPYSQFSAFADTVPYPLVPPEHEQRLWLEAIGLTRELGWLSGEAFAEWGAAARVLVLGEFESAIQHAREALRISSQVGHRQWIVASYFNLGRCYLLLLKPDLSVQHLETGLALARQLGSSWWFGNVTSHLAMAYALQGDVSRARNVLTAAMPRDQVPQDLSQRWLLLAWGQLALAESDPETALQIAERLLDSAPGSHAYQRVPWLLKLRGDAHAALGRLDQAQIDLVEAKHAARERYQPTVEWQVERSLASVFQKLGQPEMANAELQAARSNIQNLGNRIGDPGLRGDFTGAALASLLEAQPAPRRRASRQRGGLTERERQVARLVAQGRSNPEIAQTLAVRERTVESNIGRIVDKLGFHSRSQIAAWAAENGLADPTDASK